MSLSELKPVCGKKLLWVGYDPKDELFDLVFEGNTVLRVPEFIPVHADYLQKVLAERLADAENVVALRDLLKANEPAKPESTDPIKAVEPANPGDAHGTETTEARSELDPEQCEAASAEVAPTGAGSTLDCGAGVDAGEGEVGEDASDGDGL